MRSASDPTKAHRIISAINPQQTNGAAGRITRRQASITSIENLPGWGDDNAVYEFTPLCAHSMLISTVTS